jgi:hypothetical protein
MYPRRIALGIMAFACTLAVGPAVEAEQDTAPERERLLSYAADTWRSLTLMELPNGLPADGLLRTDDGTWTPASYTSPTNIAAYLWSTLAAESLGLIKSDEAGLRIDRTLRALQRMERSNGFFYNWYDAATATPLPAWPGDGPPLQPFLSSVDNAWLATAW